MEEVVVVGEVVVRSNAGGDAHSHASALPKNPIAPLPYRITTGGVRPVIPLRGALQEAGWESRRRCKALESKGGLMCVCLLCDVVHVKGADSYRQVKTDPLGR